MNRVPDTSKGHSKALWPMGQVKVISGHEVNKGQTADFGHRIL